jgi:hypothetical protein
MKLNFWQILGGLLLVVGVIGIAYRELGGSKAETPAATQPMPMQAAP